MRDREVMVWVVGVIVLIVLIVPLIFVAVATVPKDTAAWLEATQFCEDKNATLGQSRDIDGRVYLECCSSGLSENKTSFENKCLVYKWKLLSEVRNYG